MLFSLIQAPRSNLILGAGVVLLCGISSAVNSNWKFNALILANTPQHLKISQGIPLCKG